ncbi:divergent PAP2 family protein [Bacillus sp. FJAT-42376]|uniref:divergent PAP2 family protein n=1 Tax=Bacillus sp. FJAT-42376 TaxID=2014076 RepID=UPI000F4ECBC2|nr:divergent PAP2 family protein [Bacillus sp. FJAT-42376]AZB44263.1 divergent PAP2 family protein [Bacillus sp. FJAT-42376]
MDLFFNFPLIAALTAIFFAQVVKVPIHFIAIRKWDWSLVTSTGGMPSSHSAAVTALTTAVAIEDGLGSTLFAVSAIFAVITMFDATGVRRHAGEQATVLNKLVIDFNRFMKEAKDWQQTQEQEKQKKLKELLGHQPIEVFFGGITGIVLTLLMHYLFFQL